MPLSYDLFIEATQSLTDLKKMAFNAFSLEVWYGELETLQDKEFHAAIHKILVSNTTGETITPTTIKDLARPHRHYPALPPAPQPQTEQEREAAATIAAIAGSLTGKQPPTFGKPDGPLWTADELLDWANVRHPNDLPELSPMVIAALTASGAAGRGPAGIHRQLASMEAIKRANGCKSWPDTVNLLVNRWLTTGQLDPPAATTTILPPRPKIPGDLAAAIDALCPPETTTQTTSSPVAASSSAAPASAPTVRRSPPGSNDAARPGPVPMPATS